MGGKKPEIPRKISSKQTKCIKYISEECGILLGTVQSKNLVICNSGLALGLAQEDVIGLFGPFGAIECIAMLPQKTYCFVSYVETSSSIDAYNALHGKAIVPKADCLLVLAFAENVPETANMWPTLLKGEPPGAILLEDFVTVEEEQKLLQCLSWDNSNTGSSLKHRQVQHFGYEFRYSSNDVDDQSPLNQAIPEECNFLADRLKSRGYSAWDFHPDQLTVNRYFRGHGIPPHVDTHSAFEDPILSLSLLSDVVMEFRDVSGRKIPILLPRRSLLIMSGESRYGWTHGIAPRMNDIIHAKDCKGLTILPRLERISLTFRVLRSSKDCSCKYPSLCDVQKQQLFEEQNTAVNLEETYVHKVYNDISTHFSATRHKPWPNVLEFCQSFKTGQILIDIGCGNGKYLGHQEKHVKVFEIGCDASDALLNLCAERCLEVLNCNCLTLPFRSSIADGCICIAVIHHLSTHERRRQAIEEIARVLCKGGQALIYVWARDQQHKNEMSSYLKQDRKNRRNTKNATKDCVNTPLSVEENAQQFSKMDLGSAHPPDNVMCDDHALHSSSTFPLPVHSNRTDFKHRDVLVPWKLKEEYVKSDKSSVDKKKITMLRYYHMFEEGELAALCSEVAEIQVEEVRYDQGNWVVLFRKLT